MKSGSTERGCSGLLLGEIIMGKAGHTGSAQWLMDMECAHRLKSLVAQHHLKTFIMSRDAPHTCSLTASLTAGRRHG